MNLKELAKAVAAQPANHSILIYGAPKTGKTRLVGTAAAIEEINKIYWFDFENGVETLLNMGLTDEQLEKVELFKIPDTKENPRAIETMLKVFSTKSYLDPKTNLHTKDIYICYEHGTVNCVHCQDKTTKQFAGSPFNLTKCGHNDIIVIDSLSQLGDSSLAAAAFGKDSTYKLQLDDYGNSGKWLSDILTYIQQAKTTNFVCVTHEMGIENPDTGKDMIYPLCGTRNFSTKVAKYFGTVVHTDLKLKKHEAGSSTSYASNLVTGSRLNVALEKSKDGISMKAILIEGGILKPKQ